MDSHSMAALPTPETLLKKMRLYNAQVDGDLFRQAYVFSQQAHRQQKRASGEPYFMHPLAVAEILIDFELDLPTVITGLLHDTVEDTEVTLEEIGSLFGKEVAFLVDGVTKITHIQIFSAKAQQNKQYKKLLMAISADVRVLLIKLADRLHNMRTLSFVSSREKQNRIAQETLDVYVPLAERMGLRTLKIELEDLAFKTLNPDARHSIMSRLKFLWSKDQDVVAMTSEELGNLLEKEKIKGSVLGRQKSPFSIWQKMQRKNISFESVADIVGFRILVEDVATCYQVLGMLHRNYHVVPGRFKDYLSLPKKNGYAALHTTIIGPFHRRMEIQIRTPSLERVAELGVAAHWEYKQGFKPNTNHVSWIKELLELLEHTNHSHDFVAQNKLEVDQEQIFCFTPKGDLITLPQSATAIDFAYAVHSNIGNRCVGARVNGRLIPLRSTLSNGDQVDILTSELQSPVPAWEHFAVTPKAKACIRRFVKKQRREEFLRVGRTLVRQLFEREGCLLSEKILQPYVQEFSCERVEDLYVLVGEGRLQAAALFYRVFPEKETKEVESSFLRERRLDVIPLSGLRPGMEVQYASCCYPLPGDQIVGLALSENGLEVHLRRCPTLSTLAIEDKKLIPLSWSEEAEQSREKFISCIRLNLVNQPGALAILSTTIAKAGSNIVNFQVQKRHADYFEFIIDLEVHSQKHLHEIIAALRVSSWVLSTERWLSVVGVEPF